MADERVVARADAPPDGPRAEAAYASLDTPFRTGVTDRALNGQYANVYFARLAKLRPAVLEQVRAQWGLSEADVTAKLSKTLDVPEDAEDCIVLGTLYADMKLKPNVLEEYTRDPLAPAAPVLTKYCSPDDKLIIEDETGRLVLTGSVLTQYGLVTGVVLAARGRLDASSAFVVSALCVAGMPPQPAFPPSVSLSDAESEPLPSDQYLALASGLNVGVDGAGEHMLALQLLCDYLSAHLGDEPEAAFQKQIVRLVICGGCIADTDSGKASNFGEALKPIRARAQKSLAVSLQAFETLLLPVAASLPIDLMPGLTDPSNINLPQQPLHRCLLPLCSVHSHFTSTPNPHAFSINGVIALGTSGQPVLDAHKYHQQADALDTLENMLRWRHLAPTAPDTLPCFPFAMSDPFVISECPHLFFAGNQARYGTRLVKGAGGQKVRLLAVPDFSRTRTVVFVNLRTLRCHPLCFEDYVPAG